MQRVMAAAALQRELLTEEEEREKEGVGEVQGTREPLMIKRKRGWATGVPSVPQLAGIQQ
jgi:hypothetical protein